MDKSSSSSTWVVRQRGSKNPRLNWLGVGGREMGKQEWGAQLRLTEVFVSSDNRLIWASVKTAFFQAVYKLKLGPLMDKMERKVNFRSASHVKPSLTLILARDIWRFLQHRQKKHQTWCMKLLSGSGTPTTNAGGPSKSLFLLHTFNNDSCWSFWQV